MTKAAVPADYMGLVAALKASSQARLIAVCNMGGSLVDSLELGRFWASLRADLDAESHRLVTQAWLATCAFPTEAAAERSTLRAFIALVCQDKGWLAPPLEGDHRERGGGVVSLRVRNLIPRKELTVKKPAQPKEPKPPKTPATPKAKASKASKRSKD